MVKHYVKKMSGGVGVGGVSNNYIFYIVIILLSIIIVILLFFYFKEKDGTGTNNVDNIKSYSSNIIGYGCGGGGGGECNSVKRGFNDMYAPPLKNIETGGSGAGVAINIETQNYGKSKDYTQIGILTNNSGNSGGGGEPKILPLMGRSHLSNRNKWQYYSMSNTGMVNSKLPITFNGRSCLSEHGCDEIMDGDSVFVQGYNDKFIATVYENCTQRYLPTGTRPR